MNNLFSERTPIGARFKRREAEIAKRRKIAEPKLQEFKDLAAAVVAIPEHTQWLSTADNGCVFLEAYNAMTDMLPSDPLYAPIIALSSFINKEFISDEGQHSDMYYAFKELEVRFRTVEADSFGPLAVIVQPPGVTWWVAYG